MNKKGLWIDHISSHLMLMHRDGKLDTNILLEQK